MKTERLDKVLSHHGFGTRKDVKKLLHSGVVKIDDEICYNGNIHIDLDKSKIEVDNQILCIRKDVYLMMNKPAGVVCSNRDGLHKTVFDLLNDYYKQDFLGGSLHLVGRLDIDTEGLLLFTTDGNLTHRLTSPKTHVTKTYHIELQDFVPEELRPQITRRFADGVHIAPDGDDGEYDCKPANLIWIDGQTCQLVITEGRYHQVKRMIAAAGNKVKKLTRIAIGNLELDKTLLLGDYRELTDKELSFYLLAKSI